MVQVTSRMIPRPITRRSWQGTQLRVTVTADALEVVAGPGEPVSFMVRNASYVVGGGETVTVRLHGQGPVLHGRPTLEDLGESLREDGTLLSASVPTMTTSIPVITGSMPIITGDDGNLGIDT